MVAASRQRSLPLVALVVAVAMNLLNLFEPLTVDDVCHQYYAAQVAADPTHPFEFDLVWHQRPGPAWDAMVAPVNSYYWAPAIRMFGDSPTAWHLWFLPFEWLFCYSLLVLLRRWARPHATALMAALALGPSVLPGINLMLELPMMALAFASLACLLRAFDRRSVPLAIAAGCLFGLAFQTKYTAMGFFAPWVLLGVLRGRWRELLVGLAATVAVGLGIEGLVSLSHGGGSYFMRQIERTPHRDWNNLLRGFVLQTAVLGMPAALLALRGLGAAPWLRRCAAGVYLFGYLAVAFVPEAHVGNAWHGSFDAIGYFVMALTTWSIAGWFFLRLALRALAAVRERRFGQAAAGGVFFLGWFLSEMITSLVVSPFPAARRVLMMVVAFTCAAGWWLARCRGVGASVRSIAASSVLLGIGYQALDFLDGRSWVDAAQGAVAYARQHDPQAKVFFTGGWGFEFYAPRAGMQPLLRNATMVAKGDLIAVGSLHGIEMPWFEWSGKMEQVAELEFGTDGIPLSVQQGYYSGRRPIDRQSGPRFYVWMYRAVESFHTRELDERPNPWQDR